jgi:transcriptional regulator GlxA family with amidase domain
MHRIAFVALPGFRMMSLASLSAFEFANSEAGEPVYELHVLSENGGLVPTSIGVGIMTESLDRPLDEAPFDTVIVGGSAVPGALTPGVIAFLQGAVQQSRRVASTCTGAFVLAEAGLLDGRRATTHWGAARKLQARFPKVKVEEDRIFIVDGRSGPRPA